MNIEDLTAEELSQGLDLSLLSLEDKWILSALNGINEEVDSALSTYSFDKAALSSYDFFWKDFCAYYVEIVKPVLFNKQGTAAGERKNKQKILVTVLLNTIRLLHPMAPFITEELFQHLKHKFSSVVLHSKVDLYTKATIQALQSAACCVAPYPHLLQKRDLPIENLFSFVGEIVYAIRNIRGEMKIPPHLATDLYLVGPKAKEIDFSLIKALVKIDKIDVCTDAPRLGFFSSAAIGDLTILVPLPQELAVQEKERLAKETERLKISIDKLNLQLSNRDFLEKAKPELIAKQKNLLNQNEQELAAILKRLES